MDELSCYFDKIHYICENPIRFKPCDILKECKNEGYLYACYECALKRNDYTGYFECNSAKCDRSHKLSSLLKETNQNEYNNRLNDDYAKYALEELDKIRNKSIDYLKDRLNVFESYVIPQKLEFIEQDFEIRAESLKFEFEKIKLKLNQRMDEYARVKKEEIAKLSDDSRKSLKLLEDQIKRMSPEELLENQESIMAQFEKIKSDRKSKTFEIISDIIKHDQANDDEIQKEYSQNEIISKIKSLSLYSTKSHCFKRIIKNQTNNELIETVIGYLYSNASYLNINESSLSNEFEPRVRIIDLSLLLRSICGICEIGQNLIISDFASNSLNLVQNYDSYLFSDLVMNKLFKLNDSIKFKQYYAICTDEYEENLYVCDMDLHRVMIFNSNLTKLKRIISGTPNKTEFECPRDICYYDKHIYLLDQATNSIDKFTSNGDFINEYSLKEVVKNAFSIRIHSNIIAVVNWKESVHLFDLDFNFKEKIMINEILSICLCGNPNDETGLSFYLAAHCENGDVLIYTITNQDDKIECKEIYKKNFANLKYGSEFMILSKRNMIILSLGWNKSLALIEFN